MLWRKGFRCCNSCVLGSWSKGCQPGVPRRLVCCSGNMYIYPWRTGRPVVLHSQAVQNSFLRRRTRLVRGRPEKNSRKLPSMKGFNSVRILAVLVHRSQLSLEHRLQSRLQQQQKAQQTTCAPGRRILSTSCSLLLSRGDGDNIVIDDFKKPPNDLPRTKTGCLHDLVVLLLRLPISPCVLSGLAEQNQASDARLISQNLREGDVNQSSEL